MWILKLVVVFLQFFSSNLDSVLGWFFSIETTHSSFIYHSQSAVIFYTCICQSEVSYNFTYMQLLRNSGYEPTFRIEVLNSGLTGYNRILEADLAGKKPMYRSREWKKTAQGMEYQKCRKSKNWLGSYKSCIFVPPTQPQPNPNSRN